MMSRKVELLSGFALPGERWIGPDSLYLLEDLSPDELKPYIEAGCIRVTEEAEAVPAVEATTQSAPELEIFTQIEETE